MPYKHRKLNIKREDDKRVKLTDAEREEIKQLYGRISQRKLANMYGVSRRLIQFIGDPEKHEKNIMLRQLRGGWRQYYDKDKWRKTMKKFRRRKQKLYLDGKLQDNRGDKK